MTSNTKKRKSRKFCEETLQFRRLNRVDKYKSVLDLCIKTNRLPRPYETKNHKPDAYERVRGQFYVNMMVARNNGKLTNNDELLLLAKIDEYGRKSMDINQKIRYIYDFHKRNSRLPSKSHSDTMRDIQLWSRLRFALLAIQEGKSSVGFDKTLQSKVDKIIAMYQINKKPKSEKLTQILDFCKSNGRTPKQHSKDQNEKRLADRLSSTKQLMKKNKLDSSCIAIMKEIMKFPKKAIVK